MPRDRRGTGPDGPRTPQVDLEALKKIMGGSLIWVALAFLVVVVFIFATIRVGRVTGEQVGVLLSKVSGKMTVIEQSGVRIYNGILGDFFILDRTIQTLEMRGGRGEDAGAGARRRGRARASAEDSLKIKTVDGSDVYVDLKVQFRLEPSSAEIVLASSGPGEAFKEKWARDYVRSISRDFLGELTTEEFYDSSKRDAQLALAVRKTREKVQPFGIDIDRIVIPQRPAFYKEYEEMIKKKKEADQTVLEEQSKALAAKQKQLTLMVLATNEKNVAVENFRGDMEKKVIKAKAAARKATLEADAYHTRVTINAGAEFYEKQQQATGILAQKKAEAKGIEELKKALGGEGGRNMVKFEYAKKLKGVKITGQPFTVEGHTERFEHLGAPASRARRK